MPEGDTIFRTAQRLRPVLEGHLVRAVHSAEDRPGFDELIGTSMTGVEARGKHLLIHTDRDLTVHSHMGMNGSWHVYLPGQKWRKPGWQAQLELATSAHLVVCFRPKTLELLTTTQLRRHTYLNRLGPDLLSQSFEMESALRRFRIHAATPIGEAVLNQSIVSGIGNVYKSEVLFLTRTNPFVRVKELNELCLTEILEVARYHLIRNVGGHRRQTRFAGPGGSLWAYGRSGKPCFECGTTIQMRRQGSLGRSTYWCPSCQVSERDRQMPDSAENQATAEDSRPKRRIRITGA